MPRPRGTDATGATTRTRILAAAMRQIAERGYAGMRLGDVAVDAGVSLGLVQHYFGTRAGLLQAAFDAGTEVNLRRSHAIASGPGTPVERLAALLRWGTADIDPADGSWAFWFEFWLAALREPELSLRNRAGDAGWQDAFRTVLADGITDGTFAPDGTAEQVAAKLVTLLDGTMLRRMLGSQGADDDLEWAVAQFVRPTRRPARRGRARVAAGD
ncbi:MAG: TetR/AcrR family transcriptional regulator [Gaiellales bacterium]